MYDLEKIYKDVRKDIEGIGIQPGCIQKVYAINEEHNFLGQCIKHTEVCGNLCYDAFDIEICSWTLEQLQLEEVKDIVAHEILHTCKGAFSHGSEWKALAKLTNEKLGYNIRSTTTKTNASLEQKYKIECKECGYITYRKRKSKLVKYTKHFLCPECSKKSLILVNHAL